MKMHKPLFAGAVSAAALIAAAPAPAQVESYIGEVQLYANTFCPKDSVDSQGQIQAIAQNTALFALIGTTYGGNGQTTYALPDLRGRSVLDWGQGPGLSNYVLGQVGGVESETMIVSQMPAHNHTGNLRAVSGAPNADDPTGAALADFPSGTPVYNQGTAPNANMAFNTVQVSPTGGSQPIEILNPYLTMRYCTVEYGIFPSQN